MTHPLFQLKYRFDPTLPRFYKFLMIYTRIMVIFGLCFYFLRDFVNFDEIFKKDPNKQLNDLLYLGVSLAICSFSMAPLPQFLYGCCRSSYFLGQQDKLTEPGSRDEMPSSQGAHNSPEDNLITKVKIDPSIPMKLLFLLNASSHEKLIAEKDSKEAFASGGLRAVGRKLWSLQKEQGLQFANISNLGPGIPEQMDNYNGKQYIVDNLTEMDMIKNMENSQRNVIASESKIDKRESSPPHHAGRSPSLSGSINDQNNKRLITFQKGDYNTGNFSTQQRKPQHGGQPRHMSHNDIQLKFDHNRQNSIFNQQQQYRSLRSGGGTNSQILDRVQSLHQQRSHRSSNRISQTEENEEDITPRQQYEGGESTDRRKTNSPQNDLQNGPRNSSNIGGGSVLSANIINFDDDLIRGESDITIDSKIVAAEDKKELFERKGFALLGRILWILLSIGINGFVVFVVGYLYYTEQFYNKDNNYVWVVIFFGAQFVGFFIIDMIAILLIAMCVKCLCQNSKTFLAVLMRESLYVYEDYKYLAEFTFKESNEAAIEN